MSGHLQRAGTGGVAQVVDDNTDRCPSRRCGAGSRVSDRGELNVGASREGSDAREAHVLRDENGAGLVRESARAGLDRGVDVVGCAAVAGDSDGAFDRNAGDGLSQADGAAKVEGLQIEAADGGALVESSDGRDALDLGDDVGNGVAIEDCGTFDQQSCFMELRDGHTTYRLPD